MSKKIYIPVSVAVAAIGGAVLFGAANKDKVFNSICDLMYGTSGRIIFYGTETEAVECRSRIAKYAANHGGKISVYDAKRIIFDVTGRGKSKLPYKLIDKYFYFSNKSWHVFDDKEDHNVYCLMSPEMYRP